MPQVLHAGRTVSVRTLTAAVLVLWFLLTLAGSIAGIFDSEPRPPIPLGLAAVLPVAVFALCYLTSPSFQQFVLSLDLRLLIWPQTWRVVAVVFLLLYLRGALPGTFAIPAGWGDIAIGVTAPLLAWSWKPPFPRKTLVVWNVLGMLDLVVAVSLGILSSATPVGVLADDVTTRLMGQFPLSLVPTFFVPLFFILHLISLIRIHRAVP
ncbi:hypothetical protein AYO44_11250 [Planctomycetaceae bacterium SCGC AG-212-F19]|nr:hypothetical protein AYO44_11250 [Planctomycetaceae bacterium SCGC AG-212-F19]